MLVIFYLGESFLVNVLESFGLVLLCKLFWLVCMVMFVVFRVLLNVFIFFIVIELLMVFLFILGVIDLDIFNVWMSFEGIMLRVIECMFDLGEGIFKLLMVMLFKLGLILCMLMKWFLFWFCLIDKLGKCCNDLVVFWFGNCLMVFVDIIDEIWFDVCCWFMVFVWLFCWLCIKILLMVLLLLNFMVVCVMLLFVIFIVCVIVFLLR